MKCNWPNGSKQPFPWVSFFFFFFLNRPVIFHYKSCPGPRGNSLFGRHQGHRHKNIRVSTQPVCGTSPEKESKDNLSKGTAALRREIRGTPQGQPACPSHQGPHPQQHLKAKGREQSGLSGMAIFNKLEMQEQSPSFSLFSVMRSCSLPTLLNL